MAMQALFVQLRSVAHDILQRRQAAVVHIGAGAGHVAQRWNTKLAPAYLD
jgi:RES domain-containing protein